MANGDDEFLTETEGNFETENGFEAETTVGDEVADKHLTGEGLEFIGLVDDEVAANSGVASL